MYGKSVNGVMEVAPKAATVITAWSVKLVIVQAIRDSDQTSDVA